MGVEYHGWVALATSQAAWSDGDFDRAFREVESMMETLGRERGHAPAIPDSNILPRMVYLNGSDSESALPALRLLEKTGEVFDRAYGELLVFDDKGDQNECWDFSVATRYRLVDGKLTNEES